MVSRWRAWVAMAPGVLVGVRPAYAQSWNAMAQMIPVVSRATPTAGRLSTTEGYLSQPLIMARAERGRWRAVSTIDLEGLTLERGELAMGAFGEGYVDRRHPHTYVHELMVGAETSRRGTQLSVFAGRGFVPFGSDDPMMRPFEKYPVNHHLAQLLERVVIIAAAAHGPFAIEAATFNGDEPTSPTARPRFERFGDSWAGRATWRPDSSLEFSASTARVRSPEIALGHGLDHDKRSVVARYASTSVASARYALLEWARTVETKPGYRAPYRSLLAEGEYCRAGRAAAVRLERTDRPEEDRAVDPFRTPRPGSDLSTLGTTRWSIVTVALTGLRTRVGIARIAPFLEVSAGHPERLDPGAFFDPRAFYGSSTLWMASVGARIRAGHAHDRMGRYGVAGKTMSTTGSTMTGAHDMSAMPGMGGKGMAAASTGGSECGR